MVNNFWTSDEVEFFEDFYLSQSLQGLWAVIMQYHHVIVHTCAAIWAPVEFLLNPDASKPCFVLGETVLKGHRDNACSLAFGAIEHMAVPYLSLNF